MVIPAYGGSVWNWECHGGYPMLTMLGGEEAGYGEWYIHVSKHQHTVQWYGCIG